MTGWQKLNIDGVMINYQIIGKGVPIVFLHGWGVDHLIWKNQIEKIGAFKLRKFQRIYFDLPGMGNSITNHKIHNSDDMLNIICKFIDRIIGTAKYILAGESYGGYLARGLVREKESQIIGLLLLCPLIYPGYRTGSHSEHIVLESDAVFMGSLPKDSTGWYRELSVIQTKKTYHDYLADINTTIAKGNEQFLSEELDGAFSEDININPHVFTKPTTVLVGRQDTEVGFKDQYELFKDFPRASFCILDKAGHNLQFEQKDLFKAAVMELLERVLKEE